MKQKIYDRNQTDPTTYILFKLLELMYLIHKLPTCNIKYN